jgi:hypothetical protein
MLIFLYIEDRRRQRKNQFSNEEESYLFGESLGESRRRNRQSNRKTESGESGEAFKQSIKIFLFLNLIYN